jgi:hypothetical protein
MTVQEGASETDIATTAANADLELWEHHIENEVDRDLSIPTTEREALVTARRGQGLSAPEPSGLRESLLKLLANVS